MKKSIIKAAALMGFMVLFASCVKEVVSNNETYRPEGTPIVFAAATGYDNGIETRTEYSGVTASVEGFSNPFERINWVENDAIKIYYANASSYSVYYIGSTQTNANEKSTSAIDSENPFAWAGGTENHVFYGMYPNKGFSSGHGPNNSADLKNGNEVEGNIPATQSVYKKSGTTYEADMAYGYLVSKKTIDANSTATTVDLPFRPATTTFQFKFKLKADSGSSVNVSSFEMSSTGALAGDFGFTMSGADADVRTSSTWGSVSTSSTSTKITVNFKNGTTTETPAVTTDGFLDFTVFALPIPITNVTLKFNFTNGTSKSLKLQREGTWDSFQACKKYIITNVNVPGGEIWDYFIDEIPNLTTYGHLKTTSSLPFVVKSYKVKRGTTTEVPVAWTIDYSPNGSSGWTTSNDGKIDVNLTSGGGGTTLTVNNGANVMRDHGDGEWTGDDPDIEDGATAALRSAPEIPASAKDTDGYFDLSKHPVYGSNQFGSPQNMETANCYVIQRPGLYKFPLVYGNAIRNGATNTKSYAPSLASPQGHFLSNFVRHDGSAIAGPWITTDNSISVANAIIVWQDGTSNADGQIIKDADVTVDGNYIKFEVKRNLIRPGNVVIAARNSTGTIVWSWHLWVTEKDLSPKTMKDGLNNVLSMMEYNLGWMDATSAHSTAYHTWTRYVRVSQTETGGTSRVFRVRQVGDVISVDANVGCNTFYQWGRKDPMLPATGDNGDKAQYSATGLAWESSRNHHITSGGLQESIQHPNWQLVNLNGTEAHYCGSYNYGNLWDAELDNGNGNVGQFGNRFAVKTVYDPCPPGFVVPYEYAFSGVSRNANVLNYAYYPSQLYATYTANIGYKFTVPSSDVFNFPFCGARSHSGESTDSVNGSIYDVKSLGYYWTSCALKFDDTANASGVQCRRAAKMMIMMDNTLIRPGHEQRKGAAYAIRPILQTNF